MKNILKNVTRIALLKEKMLPKHIAIATTSLIFCEKQEKTKREELALKNILGFIDRQVKLNIPILTIMFPSEEGKDIKFIDELVSELIGNSIIHENKVKIMFIGNWFDLPIAIKENMKKIIDETKEYDNYFLNILVKYDGKKEVISAVKVLTLKAANKNLDPENITPQQIKESLFTSYFVPPDLIIQCGYLFSGIMLFDSPGAVIHFTNNKQWISIDKKDFDEALLKYKKAVQLERKVEETRKEESK